MARKERPQPEPVAPMTRKRVWLLAAAFLLIGIAVIPGAASPFREPKSVLTVGAILVVAGLSLTGAFVRGRVAVRCSALALVLVSLPALQALSAWWADSPRLAITASAQTAVWVLGALWIATTSDTERRRLIAAAAIGAAASSTVLILQAGGWAVLGLDREAGPERLVLTGLTGNPADLAMTAVLVLPLVITGIGTAGSCWPRRLLAGLLSVAVVVSQTLTGVIALVLVWAVWLVQQRSRRLWLGAAVAAAVVLVAGLATGLDQRIERQLWRLRHGDWYFLLSARSDGWTAAADMTRSHPLTGVGAGNFTHAYYPSRVAWVERTGVAGHRSELATHFDLAHCDPLQMVAELGIPGLLWMAALVFVLVRDRPRGDPLPPMAAAAFVPFAALHFPTHLAVGLVPLILILGHVLAGSREIVLEPAPWLGRTAAALVAIAVVIGSYWQLQRLTLDVWRGGLRYDLTAAERLEGAARAQQAALVEAQILPRLPALAGSRSWLWRLVGRARLLREDDVGAETAFRNAMTLWPHEEAEFGLGLALAAQGDRTAAAGLDEGNRRGEAILHLTRVCRTNPALIKLIPDPELRNAVTDIVRAAERIPDR